MQRLRSKLSFANVTAFIALFIALGGAAYAANSVNGKDIINGSITGKDIKKGSIPLTALKTLPAGTPGPAGATGAPGSALAFAHVNKDGTLDAANSKNIAATQQTTLDGYYCVTPTVAVQNISATASDIVAWATIAFFSFADPNSLCPANAGVVRTFNGDGYGTASEFFVTFN